MSERPSAREQSLKGFVQDNPPSVNFSIREAPLQKELFTLAECATILSLSERTVEALVAQGYLRSAVPRGTERSRRVSRAMLEEYIRDFDGEDPFARKKGPRA
jgi:excisionase family DNA binding protein